MAKKGQKRPKKGPNDKTTPRPVSVPPYQKSGGKSGL